MKKSKYEIIKLFAFCAFLLAAAVWALEVFNVNVSTLTFIKEIFVLIAIAVPSFGFVKSFGKKLIVIYFIILLLMIASLAQINFNLIAL